MQVRRQTSEGVECGLYARDCEECARTECQDVDKEGDSISPLATLFVQMKTNYSKGNVYDSCYSKHSDDPVHQLIANVPHDVFQRDKFDKAAEVVCTVGVVDKRR